MLIRKIVLLLLSVYLLLPAVQLRKLIMVQELFRHGARYPIYINNGDYSQYAKT